MMPRYKSLGYFLAKQSRKTNNRVMKEDKGTLNFVVSKNLRKTKNRVIIEDKGKD